MFTYTSDQRFSVVQHSHVDEEEEEAPYYQQDHRSRYEDWILQIKYVQPRDAGVYECQVSTEPRISQDFYLSVVGQCLCYHSVRPNPLFRFCLLHTITYH